MTLCDCVDAKVFVPNIGHTRQNIRFNSMSAIVLTNGRLTASPGTRRQECTTNEYNDDGDDDKIKITNKEYVSI